MPFGSEIGQKLGDFFWPHFTGVFPIVEMDKPSNPLEIAFLCDETHVSQSHSLAHDLKQTRAAFYRRRTLREASRFFIRNIHLLIIVDSTKAFHRWHVSNRIS